MIPMKNMRILITGGAGFIGSYLAKRLIAAGHQIVLVDNLSTGKRQNVPAETQFLELDVSHPESIAAFPKDPFDAVCHLAAQSSGPASADIPYEDFKVNAASTLLLSRWCLEHEIPRFLYASSMAVYGNPPSPCVSETTPCLPVSYYGVSKLTSENLLRLASREGLSVTALRMFSVYGPGQNLANLKQGMASIYLAYMLQGEEVPVSGSLDRFRDLVYIDDVIQAWMFSLEHPLKKPGVATYNLGSGIPTTVRTLLQELLKAMDLPSDYPIQELLGSPSDQFGVYADIQKATDELGWRPRVSLQDGLKQMASWAKASDYSNQHAAFSTQHTEIPHPLAQDSGLGTVGNSLEPRAPSPERISK